MSAPGSHSDQRGAALLITLLLAALLGAIAVGLISLTIIETLVGASHRGSHEALYAADGALERGVHDLSSLPDWNAVLARPPANLVSGFVDGRTVAPAPDGRRLDLGRLTIDRQRESDSLYVSRAGVDAPQWRLFAHAPIGALLATGGVDVPSYVLVWVADDLDGDGDPTIDANGRVLLHAESYGAGGARRVVQASVGRTADGIVRVMAWNPVW